MASTKAAKSPVHYALFATLEAKAGKEQEVADFLTGALSVVEQEPATITWYAIKLGPSTFGIFDTFPDENGRNAHLTGQVAAALMQKAPELFSKAPDIKKLDVLAAKLPS
jgi:quinol monooxygenase YgiN